MVFRFYGFTGRLFCKKRAPMGQKYEILYYFAPLLTENTVLNLELDIARRIARAPLGGSRSVMERIAVASVALSAAVMFLSIAIITGFKREISRRISDFSSHVVVTDPRSVGSLDAAPVSIDGSLDSLAALDPAFRRAARYAVRGGIVRTAEAVEGVVLKGVDGAYDLAPFRRWLAEGELPRIGDSVRTKDVLLPRELARRLALGVGDRFELLFAEADARLRRDRFRIAGIYASGMDELDRTTLLTDLRNVQRLAGWSPDEVSGCEIRIDRLEEAPAFAERLDLRLFYDESERFDRLAAVSVQELYPNIFDWLKAHDVNAAVILTIMLAVAFFNLSAALLTVVLERVRMIGLLQALGMTRRSLRRIFRYRASLIALRGLAWGNAAGLALCLVQQRFGLVRLDAEGYLLSVVPIALEWGWWLLLNAGLAAAIFLLMLLPATAVASIKPDETMRYE